VRQVLASAGGTFTAEGLDGRRGIFGVMHLPTTEARLVVSFDEREVLSRIDREVGIAYVQLVLFGIIILLAAWFGGERLIVEPIRALSRIATRIGRGELDVHPGRQTWAAEFAPLAAALDDTAVNLAKREHDLRAANLHLEELASIDGLSGLANRRSFNVRLEAEWQRAAKLRRPVSLLMIDVDHFKLFNDNYGHVAGDNCLRVVGAMITAMATRTSDFAARYGGEEFTLLLPDAAIEKALEIAERLRGEVDRLAIVNEGAPAGAVTVSIGVAALVPAADQDARTLIEAADIGLYAAKRRGRNAVVAHTAVELVQVD
jgi:diguanylate cyclase (GGDEF)-like protein